jgi:hypothetical protein
MGLPLWHVGYCDYQQRHPVLFCTLIFGLPLLGIQHSMTTAYHPQANGMVERAHRQLKDALRARLAGDNLPEHLPWVLLGLRPKLKDTVNVSATEAVLGMPLVLPSQLLTGA